MGRKFLLLALVGLLLNFTCVAPVLASGPQDKEAKRIAKAKKQIDELGTGPRAKVEVKLRDKTKVAGYISEIKDDSFIVVTDEKTNATTSVSYAQVEKVTPTPSLKNTVKDLGNTRTFKAIGIGLGLITLAVLAFCLTGRCEE